MWKQTVVALGLFEIYFFALVPNDLGRGDPVLLAANLGFAAWLVMEASRVRLGHGSGESRTFGVLSRSFLIASFASVALAFAERAGGFSWGVPKLPDEVIIPGAVLLAAGVWLRHLSIKTLGRYFVTKVQITHDHELIREGIYNLLRHPSYTGLILGFAGTLLLLQSGAAFTVFLLLGIPAYLYRIRVEEAALVGVFGERYQAYRAETYALVPYLY